LDQCEYAVKWSREFVQGRLEKVMFAERDANGLALPMTPIQKAAAKSNAKKVALRLSSYQKNKTHSEHIHFAELEKIGLKVFPLEKQGEDEFQDLVLTVHHCYMHTLMNTPAIKIIENHLGAGMIKLISPQLNASPQNSPPTGE